MAIEILLIVPAALAFLLLFSADYYNVRKRYATPEKMREDFSQIKQRTEAAREVEK